LLLSHATSATAAVASAAAAAAAAAAATSKPWIFLCRDILDLLEYGLPQISQLKSPLVSGQCFAFTWAFNCTTSENTFRQTPQIRGTVSA